MDVPGERPEGHYRGTAALNVAVSDRPRELVLVALDLWDHAAVLRGTATIDREDPFWVPLSWRITTDAGTVHRPSGGGGGSSGWLVRLEPAIPEGAREIRVFVGPDGEAPRDDRSLPGEPAPVASVMSSPTAVRRVPATVDGAAELGADVGRLPSLEDRSVRPIRVLAVSARLDDVVGRDINVLSIETYPDWFIVRLGGSGGLPGLMSGGMRRQLRRRWTGEDDRGGRYQGTFKSAHSGWPWIIGAPFTPALDPEATRLTLAFPNPFGGGVVETTLDLASG